MAQTIADRYEIEELVGTGGMSRVYRARDRSLERTVALKVLHEHYAEDDDYVERFQREARAVAQLAHPNIVTVIDRGEDAGGRPFIVFEFVHGENLRERMIRCGPLGIRQVLELGSQIARALAFAHEHGLVHRDVKPQNVIVNGDDGRAQVTDFGIARSLEVDVERGMTQPGTVLGTSTYISPEQARGERVEAASDIYSLGAVLYELLTGRPPFEGESFVAVALQHVHAPVPSVLERRVDCPLRLAHALDRALAKDPEDRFATMGDVAAELEACLAELGEEPDLDATLIQARPVLRESRRRTERVSRRAPLVALGLLVALAALGAVAYLLGRDGSPSSPGRSAAAATGPVQLSGAGALDPFGDGEEHADRAALVTDGSPATYWNSQTYRSGLAKAGVGVVVSTARPVVLRSLTVETSTPGFTAEVRTATGFAGSDRPGPVDSAAQSVQGRTVFRLQGKRSRYWVVWITDLGGQGLVRITDVRATA